MNLKPEVFPPALPSELLSFIISQCAYPTTLVICTSKADFISGLVTDIRHQTNPESDLSRTHQGGEPPHERPNPHEQSSSIASDLLQAPLYQVAIARHIRLVFIPTVSHLRAFLSVFSPHDSKIPAPPETTPDGGPGKKLRLLLVYGFLDLHHYTSEWSAQGLSSTAAILVEAGKRVDFQAIIVEARKAEGGDELAEFIPVLGGSARRMGLDMDEGVWSSRTVQVRRVLGRWFRFRSDEWESGRARS